MTDQARDLADVHDITIALLRLKLIQARGAAMLPEHLRDRDPADFRTAALAMFVELGELVNECQWKPWRNYLPPTDAEREKVVKEMADVLHMLAWMMNNLEDRFGLTEDDFAKGMVAVAVENRRRFAGQVPGREPPTLAGSLRAAYGDEVVPGVTPEQVEAATPRAFGGTMDGTS